MISPTTLIAFTTWLGHLEHWKFESFSYFTPFSSFCHSDHRIPPYPCSQLTGWVLLLLYPPLHASELGHSTIDVEFVELLQYPESILSFSCPKQNTWSIQFSHFVEFHVKEKEPSDHW